MSDPKIYTRPQLYDLVSTTPKHQLPAKLGLSDVVITSGTVANRQATENDSGLVSMRGE